MSRPLEACALCHKVRYLADSHLIARAFYKLVKDKDNPKHSFIGQSGKGQTTRQLSQYLLCDGCEERFNIGGEKWVLSSCVNSAGEFPLRDALQKVAPFAEQGDTAAYRSTDVPGLHIDQIIYFAASVFWRASVRRWRLVSEVETHIELGPYEEALRIFLLGESLFPQNAVLVISASSTPQPHTAISAPGGRRTQEQYFQYEFHIPGMVFYLVVGQRLPKYLRALCAVWAPDRPILVTPYVDEGLMALMVHLSKNQPKTGQRVR